MEHVVIASASWPSGHPDSYDEDSLRAEARAMNDPQLHKRTIRQIQDAVARMFGLNADELSKESGPHLVAMPRHIAMYLSKQLTDASASEIGLHFGGRQGTSVRYSIVKIHQLRAIDPQTAKAIETLLGALAVSLGGSKSHESHDGDTYPKD